MLVYPLERFCEIRVIFTFVFYDCYPFGLVEYAHLIRDGVQVAGDTVWDLDGAFSLVSFTDICAEK